MSKYASSTAIDWAPGPNSPMLKGEHVHVWRFNLDNQTPETLEQMRTWLSAEECARVDRFHRPRDGVRFLVGRAAMREILARYLGTTPDRLCFSKGPFGKPSIAEPNPSRIQFNLSHSHGQGALAVSQGRELGIDIELIRPMESMDAIANRFFSATENQVYLSLAEVDRPLAFFRIWTRKEAYLKGTGTGISVPLDSFDVSVRPDERPSLLRVANQPGEVERWSMLEFWPEPKALVSLAVEGPVGPVHGFDYAPRIGQ